MTGKVKANEKTTLQVTGQFQDEEGNGLPASVFDVLMLSIYLKSDISVFLRSSDDIRHDPNFVIDSDGNFTWQVRAFETEILKPESVSIGRVEDHVAVFEFAWNSPRNGSLTDPFETVSGSKFMTVTMPGHALAVDDNVYFLPMADVGGLDLGGHYIIRSVIDANHFTIEHFSKADSTATGGGTVEWFANGRAASADIAMQIKRLDPV